MKLRDRIALITGASGRLGTVMGKTLARLWQSQGKATETRDLFTPVLQAAIKKRTGSVETGVNLGNVVLFAIA